MNPEALTQGNWSMAATSNGSAGSFNIGGNLSQSGSSLAGTMYVVGSCISTSEQVAFTGSVSGNNITLASSGGSGQVITLSLTGTASSLTGTAIKLPRSGANASISRSIRWWQRRLPRSPAHGTLRS